MMQTTWKSKFIKPETYEYLTTIRFNYLFSSNTEQLYSEQKEALKQICQSNLMIMQIN